MRVGILAHTVGILGGGAWLGSFEGQGAALSTVLLLHAWGAHALQVFPLLGWLLQRRVDLGERARFGRLAVAVAGYVAPLPALVAVALDGRGLESLARGELAAAAAGLAVIGAVFAEASIPSTLRAARRALGTPVSRVFPIRSAILPTRS